MKISEWVDNYDELTDDFNDNPLPWVVTPETWGDFKLSILKYVKEVDQLTEVYEMENKK